MVRALLDRLRPADEREAGFVDRMRALLDSAGDPFARDHFVPGHFTASAFVLAPDTPDVLLVLHGKLHRWLQPGGHFDPEDAADPLAAARREVAEEVGIHHVDLPLGAALLDVDIHEIPALRSEPPHLHFDLRVLFRARSREHQAGSDAADARWVGLDDVGLDASDASVMRAIVKIRDVFPGLP